MATYSPFFSLFSLNNHKYVYIWFASESTKMENNRTQKKAKGHFRPNVQFHSNQCLGGSTQCPLHNILTQDVKIFGSEERVAIHSTPTLAIQFPDGLQVEGGHFMKILRCGHWHWQQMHIFEGNKSYEEI
jgi:hypothetical protein